MIANLSCPVLVLLSRHDVQKLPPERNEFVAQLCGLTNCLSLSSAMNRFVFSDINLISKLVTW